MTVTSSRTLALASRVAAALAVLSAAASAGLGGCQAPDENKITEVLAPDYAPFKGVGIDGALQAAGVSRMMERRCGTLDCHGQEGRPLRIYGQNGLRFVEDGGDRPGVQPTTETEHLANYQAVIALQPEAMSRVVSGIDAPEALMLLRKPLGLERHKGGTVFVSGDDAYVCIATWIAGHLDFGTCGRASQ
jgi:hypothetical protein